MFPIEVIYKIISEIPNLSLSHHDMMTLMLVNKSINSYVNRLYIEYIHDNLVDKPRCIMCERPFCSRDGIPSCNKKEYTHIESIASNRGSSGGFIVGHINLPLYFMINTEATQYGRTRYMMVKIGYGKAVFIYDHNMCCLERIIGLTKPWLFGFLHIYFPKIYNIINRKFKKTRDTLPNTFIW